MRIFSVARATAFYDFGNNVAEDFGALRTAENHNLKFVLFAERGERNFADFGNGLRMGIPVRMVLMPAGAYFTFLKLWAMRAAYLLRKRLVRLMTEFCS